MDRSLEGLLYRVGESAVGYLPNLLAGLILIALGLLLAWLAKRVTVQVCVVLHLDRILRRFRWGEGFSKADARYALFNWVGGTAAFVVCLVFFDAAFATMHLTVLSSLLERAVWFIPALAVALLIFGLGSIVAGRVAAAIQTALRREAFPRATLIARFSKLVLMLFFSAMALAQLDIARPIVIIGFTTIIVTLCLLAVIAATRSGRALAEQLQGGPDDEESR